MLIEANSATDDEIFGLILRVATSGFSSSMPFDPLCPHLLHPKLYFLFHLICRFSLESPPPLAPGSSMSNAPFLIYCVCPGHHKLVSLNFCLICSTPAVSQMYSFLILFILVTCIANLSIFTSATSNSTSFFLISVSIACNVACLTLHSS